MPQKCSQCSAMMADDTVQCPHCGQPREAGTAQYPQDQQVEDRRFPFWTILPWTLLAAAALFFLPHLLHSSQAGSVSGSQTRAAHAAQAVSAAPAPVAVPIAPTVVPLTVTLSTASDRRHVLVGTPVMISAYASLPPGQSATLAISYGRGDGPKTLLALAQGTLASAEWVPVAPGRYRFTASALDSRKNGAFSHHLTLTAEAPPVPTPVKQAPARTRAEITRAEQAAPKRAVTKQAVPERAAAKPRTLRPRPQPAALPLPFHVAAASFRVKRIADTLAGALRQRGFHAFVRPNAAGQYRVETGDFVHRADADKQLQLLKRDGYPSYVFQTH